MEAPTVDNNLGASGKSGIYQRATQAVQLCVCLAGAKLALVIIFGLAFLFSTYGTSRTELTALGEGVNSDLIDVTNRPGNLRQLIHTATQNARAASTGALVTSQTRSIWVYDNNIEFVVSVPAIMQTDEGEQLKAVAGRSRSSNLFDTTTVSNSTKPGIAGETPAIDPLSASLIDPTLRVMSFGTTPGVATFNNDATTRLRHDIKERSGPPYSIILNKFNTIQDHCLLVTDRFEPQLSPLLGNELELLHWIVTYSTNAVGFYNSDARAGASQAHRHFQFIPVDQLWSLRNPDAPHGLPIDDIILPNIELGKWHQFRFHPISIRKGQADPKNSGNYVYELEQFRFRHGVAVLQNRAGFSPYGAAADTKYAEYLRKVYEYLLQHTGVDVNKLLLCSRTAVESPMHNHHSNNAPIGSDTTPAECSAPDSGTSYNLILTATYMMVVPRSAASFKAEGTENARISINSFGFMGMLLAQSNMELKIIRDVGPLHILEAVGYPQ